MTKTQKPKLLDLFCCLQGTTVGYEMAGFQGYGVDIFEKYNRKRCPLPTAKMDAIECMDKLLAGEKIQFSHWDEIVKAYVDDELLGLEDFSLLTASLLVRLIRLQQVVYVRLKKVRKNIQTLYQRLEIVSLLLVYLCNRERSGCTTH